MIDILLNILINTRIHQNIDQIDLILLLAKSDDDYQKSVYYAFTIEVKELYEYNIKNIDNKNRVFVENPDISKNASLQCNNGVFAFHNFIKNHHYGISDNPHHYRLWVQGILWFPRYKNPKYENCQVGYIYLYHKMKENIIQDFINNLKYPKKIKFNKEFFEQYTNPVQYTSKKSRDYIENTTITRWKSMQSTDYYKNFNAGKTKTLRITGAPGTGETYLLLGFLISYEHIKYQRKTCSHSFVSSCIGNIPQSYYSRPKDELGTE